MREIKFRAWIPKSKEMEYGIALNGLGQHHPQGDDAIVMQYTGLHDKNGKGIYEGDILAPSEHLKEQGNQIVKYVAKKGYAGFVTNGDLQFDECDVVIGNIYEHSHLLDTKTEK